jgi:hypothetical protein
MNIFSTKKKHTITGPTLLILHLLLFSLLFSGTLLLADTNGADNHGKPLEAVLQEIREKQDLEPDESINPRTVSDTDLEELGEAVMSVMHPDPKQHEFMDNMMGGEGSRRLARMHRRIGYNYLAEERGYFDDDMKDSGMMRKGSQRGGMNGRSNHGKSSQGNGMMDNSMM